MAFDAANFANLVVSLLASGGAWGAARQAVLTRFGPRLSDIEGRIAVLEGSAGRAKIVREAVEMMAPVMRAQVEQLVRETVEAVLVERSRTSGNHSAPVTPAGVRKIVKDELAAVVRRLDAHDRAIEAADGAVDEVADAVADFETRQADRWEAMARNSGSIEGSLGVIRDLLNLQTQRGRRP